SKKDDASEKFTEMVGTGLFISALVFVMLLKP
ncbi:MAG: hypothetical protein UT20_C0021G0001, partial [Candidatus Levybacteria bacterium GW2011_GWA1_39_11]